MSTSRRALRWMMLMAGTLLLVGAEAQDALRLARFSVHGGGGVAEGESAALRVAIGQTAVAGETVLAAFDADPATALVRVA